MNNIDLKIYTIDDMNIQDLMNQTSMGNLNLKDLYNHLKYKFQLFTRDKEKREYLLNNLEEWERELILNGILAGEVIEKNLHRQYFNRDRGFYLNNKYYEDVFLTTLWVAMSKIFEEKTTLAFINSMKNFDGKFIENERAPQINDTSCINSEPDFVWIKKDGSRVMVEQKCSYTKNYSIKIRKGQMKNFERYNDDVVILVKDETNLCQDEYNFYYYKDIKPFLKENNYGGNVKYYVTRLRLLENNIYPFKFITDRY